MLELQNVGLEIPVLTTKLRSLKASLIRSVTGGRLSRSRGGAVITACKMTLNIRQGGRVALIGVTVLESPFSGLCQASISTLLVTKAHVPVFPMIHKSFITSPELSGSQAIKAHYLLVHGHLQGFEEFCEDVICFSGLGDFIHLPVKTYSQGMAARLLFAVLTGGSHDCLAMDEGFGAGDTSFYEKARNHDALSEFSRHPVASVSLRRIAATFLSPRFGV